VTGAKAMAGVLAKETEKDVEVSFPPIAPEDVAMLTDTLVKQIDSGLLSKDSARRMIPWISDPSREKLAVEKDLESGK
jgi:hypothetical protein